MYRTVPSVHRTLGLSLKQRAKTLTPGATAAPAGPSSFLVLEQLFAWHVSDTPSAPFQGFRLWWWPGLGLQGAEGQSPSSGPHPCVHRRISWERLKNQVQASFMQILIQLVSSGAQHRCLPIYLPMNHYVHLYIYIATHTLLKHKCTEKCTYPLVYF